MAVVLAVMEKSWIVKVLHFPPHRLRSAQASVVQSEGVAEAATDHVPVAHKVGANAPAGQ